MKTHTLSEQNSLKKKKRVNGKLQLWTCSHPKRMNNILPSNTKLVNFSMRDYCSVKNDHVLIILWQFRFCLHCKSGLFSMTVCMKADKDNDIGHMLPPKKNNFFFFFFFFFFFKGNGIGWPLFLLFTSTIYSPQ